MTNKNQGLVTKAMDKLIADIGGKVDVIVIVMASPEKGDTEVIVQTTMKNDETLDVFINCAYHFNDQLNSHQNLSIVN